MDWTWTFYLSSTYLDHATILEQIEAVDLEAFICRLKYFSTTLLLYGLDLDFLLY